MKNQEKKFFVVCASKCCGFAGFMFKATNMLFEARSWAAQLNDMQGVQADIIEVFSNNLKNAKEAGKEKYFNEVFGKC